MRLLQMWKSLPDWAKPVVVGLLLTLLAGVWRIISWLINRFRTSVDDTVTDFLARNTSGLPKTIKEISVATDLCQKKVKASLYRLRTKHQVDNDEQGRWHKVRY